MDEESRHAATGAPPPGDTTRPPAVGGTLLDALDAALVTAWDDDTFVEALCSDEGLVGALADLEYAVEVLRSALVRLPRHGVAVRGRDRRPGNTGGSRPSRTGKGKCPDG